MITVLLVLAGVAAVGYVLVARVRGQALNARRMLRVPAVLAAIGLIQVIGFARHGVSAADAVLVLAGVVLSAALGVTRGATVALYHRGGQPWLRYRPATLGLWGVTLVVRVALAVLAHAVGATVAASGPAILLSVGATLLGEGLMVAHRALPGAGSGWQARIRRNTAVSR